MKNQGLVVTGVTSVLILSMCCGCTSATHTPLRLAENVDMDRMYGGWHIVATIPNGFEKGMVAPYDVYTKRPDGDIREDFYVQRGGFSAKRDHFTVHDWVKPGTNNSHWRVQVLWPINLPFLVLFVDPDYRYIIYGEEDRKIGWIYSRTPYIPDEDYQSLLAKLSDNGYDAKKFRKIVQKPEDIGKPGYWSDSIKP